MYIYIYVYIYIYIHMYIYIYIYKNIYYIYKAMRIRNLVPQASGLAGPSGAASGGAVVVSVESSHRFVYISVYIYINVYTYIYIYI